MNIYIPTREERERLRAQRIVMAQAKVNNQEAKRVLKQDGNLCWWRRGQGTILPGDGFEPAQRLLQGPRPWDGKR